MRFTRSPINPLCGVVDAVQLCRDLSGRHEWELGQVIRIPSFKGLISSFMYALRPDLILGLAEASLVVQWDLADNRRQP